MLQLLQTLLADREYERAERQANIAALQQIANQGHGNHDHPGSKLKNFQNTNPPVFSKTEEPLDADDWLQTMENNLEVAGVEENEKVLFATHYLAGPARAWWTSARALNAGQMMTWADFKLKFSKYHVPPGLIKKMRDEFRELKQGRMSVVEYRDRFLTLSRTGSNAIPVATKDKSTITCYECGVVGHFSNECPKRLAKLAGNTSAPAQQQRRVSTGKKFAPNNPNNRGGRLYHMNAEEAQEAPDVVLARLSPQLRQTERVNQILEDMLGAVYWNMDPSGKTVCPTQFSYNNVIKPAYGWPPLKPCTEGSAVPLELVKSEKAKSLDRMFFEKPKRRCTRFASTSRLRNQDRKSYADKRRREMTFEIGDFVYLKVSPLKGMQRFQVKGKLAPRYVGPFKVLSRRRSILSTGTTGRNGGCAQCVSHLTAPEVP
ncbi:hypothetical protein QYE76_062668 [Lolium multiflorum]|uniref:CCHC-type domain-containing protein n=1 Tax=Lolium multiflorum TaxID=4521 RepID=A0AAD8S4W9_LOLMU|nr:hypothetical protein QYE76_062668 [Lolium multiflorum]